MNALARSALILGIDPGKGKCGLAIVPADRSKPRNLAIVRRPELFFAVQRLCEAQPIDAIALGSGTEGKAAAEELQVLGWRIELVDEYGSTLAARSRYFQANPPRGWRRLLPRGLLVPNEPIDDWAAVIIAERYLESFTR